MWAIFLLAAFSVAILALLFIFIANKVIIAMEKDRAKNKQKNETNNDDEKGEIKLGAVISGNGEEKLRLLFLVNGIPTKLYDGSDYIEINARTGYLYEIKPDKILDVKPYDSIDILIMYCLDESEKTHMSCSAFPSVILPYANEK